MRSAVALFAVTTGVLGCSGKSGASEADRVAAGVSHAIEAAAAHHRPVPCARVTAPPEALAVAAAKDRAVIGFVADARGAGDVARAAATRAAAVFREAGVDVIIGVGGMASTADELRAIYTPLAGAAPTVLIVAGDREQAAAVAEVSASLSTGGANVLDGSHARAIAVAGLSIDTLPGVREPAQLTSGNAGCVYYERDTKAVGDALATRSGTRVLVAFAPPRQRGEAASDLSSGVHIGDPLVADAAKRGGAVLVVHGLVDATGARTVSDEATAAVPASVSVGPLERIGQRGPVSQGTVVIARETATGVAWQRVALDLPKVTPP